MVGERALSKSCEIAAEELADGTISIGGLTDRLGTGFTITLEIGLTFNFSHAPGKSTNTFSSDALSRMFLKVSFFCFT